MKHCKTAYDRYQISCDDTTENQSYIVTFLKNQKNQKQTSLFFSENKCANRKMPARFNFDLICVWPIFFLLSCVSICGQDATRVGMLCLGRPTPCCVCVVARATYLTGQHTHEELLHVQRKARHVTIHLTMRGSIAPWWILAAVV